MLKKFAEELKEAREKSGISLQQIHSKTRIDVKFLEAIENGNFEILPEVYLRAFIKAYANSIGLNEIAELKRYDLAKAGKLHNEEEIAETAVEKEPIKHEKPTKVFSGSEIMPASVPEENVTRSGNVNIKYILFSMLLLVGIGAVYFFFIKDSSKDIITEKPYNEILNENKQRYEVKTPDTSKQTQNNNTFSTKDSLTLLVKSKDTSWIGIKLDNGAKEQDFIIYPYGQKRIRASKNYLVTIGNSRSIELLLNDKSLNFAGRYKEVKVVKIDSTGLSYITPTKIQTKKND